MTVATKHHRHPFRTFGGLEQGPQDLPHGLGIVGPVRGILGHKVKGPVPAVDDQPELVLARTLGDRSRGVHFRPDDQMLQRDRHVTRPLAGAGRVQRMCMFMSTATALP